MSSQKEHLFMNLSDCIFVSVCLKSNLKPHIIVWLSFRVNIAWALWVNERLTASGAIVWMWLRLSAQGFARLQAPEAQTLIQAPHRHTVTNKQTSQETDRYKHSRTQKMNTSTCWKVNLLKSKMSHPRINQHSSRSYTDKATGKPMICKPASIYLTLIHNFGIIRYKSSKAVS